jgi:hypothetical protein
MPNWCTNVLRVQEDVETSGDELYDFLTRVRGNSDGEEKESEFCLSSLVPRPEGVDWYDWNVKNWGTKWDISADIELQDDYFDDDEGGAVAIVRFDSAWSPPIEWVEKVAPMFPTLTFELRFWEGGMGFAGKYTKNGDDVYIEEYRSDDDGYWEIATEDMTDEEIEDRAKENIANNALEYWEYTLNDLVRYIGEEHRQKIENLLLVKKLIGELGNSSNDEFIGSDIADIVEELLGAEKFYDLIFDERKKQNGLRKLAA